MWDSYPGGYQGYQNQILLATGGHDYGPQFGPAEPRYEEPGRFPCGCSEEDSDGIDCGHAYLNDLVPEPPEPEELIFEADIDGGEEQPGLL